MVRVLGDVLRFGGRRLWQAVVVLWAAFTLSFVLLYWLPGDAVAAKLASGGEASTATPEQIAELRAQYGLDAPLYQQYLSQLVDTAQGDLGTSVRSGRPVGEVITEVLPQSFLLIGSALVLAVLLGGGLALAATYARHRGVRQFLSAVPGIGISVPTFVVGLVLVSVISFGTGWLPAAGNEGLESLVLPAITLALPSAAVIAQVLGKSMRSALAEPFAETAHAKGVSPRAVHLRHALPNASIPVVTATALLIGNMIAGSAVVESVFSRIGLGRLIVESVDAQDVPVIQGVVVFSALIFVVANFVVDLLYSILDPRLSLVGSARR